jgi:hypothetical protein
MHNWEADAKQVKDLWLSNAGTSWPLRYRALVNRQHHTMWVAAQPKGLQHQQEFPIFGALTASACAPGLAVLPAVRQPRQVTTYYYYQCCARADKSFAASLYVIQQQLHHRLTYAHLRSLCCQLSGSTGR